MIPGGGESSLRIEGPYDSPPDPQRRCPGRAGGFRPEKERRLPVGRQSSEATKITGEGSRSSPVPTDGHDFRSSDAGAVRPAPDRADQRLVLCPAFARARRHLRTAQHHQLHARRAVHDGRVLRMVPARQAGLWATGGHWRLRRSRSARSAC